MGSWRVRASGLDFLFSHEHSFGLFVFSMLLFVFWKVLLCSEGDTVLGDDITIFSRTYPKLGVLLRAIFPVFQ